MVRAAIGFFILAIVAYLFGASNVAGLSMEIGQALLVVFLILAALTFVGALILGRRQSTYPK